MNCYTMSYCPNCQSMHHGSQLSVHGAEAVNRVKWLEGQGKIPAEIYESFCGYCGSYIEGKKCPCGHTRRQQYFEE